jgi:hypothetical protein
MNARRRRQRLGLIGLALVAGLLAGAAGWAQVTGYEVTWWTVDSGAGSSSGGNYSLSGTLGQPDAGTLAGGSYQVLGGYWGVPLASDIFLPILRR